MLMWTCGVMHPLPLLISANIRDMSQMNIETYTNTHVIAVNQDEFGKQGQRVMGDDLSARGSSGRNVWSKELMDGSRAMVFLNNNAFTVNVTCDAQCFKNAGIYGIQSTVYDLWQDMKQVAVIDCTLYTAMDLNASGGVAMYKVVPNT